MIYRFLVILTLSAFGPFLSGQVIADFTHDFNPSSSNSCAPISVAFTNTSTGATSYTWSINGVSFSTSASPQRAFAAGGAYNICLTSSDGSATDQFCEVLNINDQADIVISTTPASGCTPYNATIGVVSSKQVTTATIDYGDGIIDFISPNATTFSSNHTYSQSGTYSVTVSIIDDNGCSSTTSSANLFTIRDVENLGFSIALSSCVIPLTASFTNTTPNASNYSFTWDFGDGGSGTGVNASHAYTVAGTYNVSLTAVDNLTGCSETYAITDAINSQTAVSILSTEVDNGDCSMKEIAFSIDNLPTGSTVNWDFGDGNSSTNPEPTHIYLTAGCFAPSVEITTPTGCIFTITHPCITSIGPNDPSFTMTGDLNTCNPTTGTSIQFNSNSTIATAWSWDFGDGNSSTTENPSHQYTGFGTYAPVLTTTYSDGCTQIYSDLLLQVVIAEPIITIVVDSARGCIPFDATFSIAGSNDPIASIAWDFGFTTSTNTNPTITYTAVGDYSMDATVTTTTGCVLTATAINLIEVGSIPNVSFAVDTFSACVDAPIQFTDLSDSTVDEWEWDFGSGGSMEQNPTHNYTEPDSFEVTLTAYYNGCPNDYTETRFINIGEPKASFVWEYDCSTNNTLHFTDLSTGADSIWWDFGDGSPMIDVANPSHVYPGEGAYTITQFTKNFTTGCIDDQTLVISLVNPVANFVFSTNRVCRLDTLVLTNFSQNVSDITWTITNPSIIVAQDGDDGEDAKLVFTQPGSYSGFSLEYRVAPGCAPRTLTFSEIVDVDFLFPNFSYQIDNCLPADLTITNTSFPSSLTDPTIVHTWQIGDSIIIGDAPNFQFTQEGTYEINMSMSNGTGCTAVIASPVYVTIEVPVPDFNWSMSDCDTREISFLNLSSGTNITSFLWDFGDGNTSTQANPIHNYASNGDYTVVFTVLTNSGCSEQISQTVQVQNPVADFVGDNLSKSCPNPALITNFTNNSIGGNSYEWDFGDGGTSTLPSPAHAFSTIDTFDIQLIVTSVNGCTDTLIRTNYIALGGPFANLAYSTTSSCSGSDISFIVQGEGVSKYTWDFGDGNAINSIPISSSDTVNYAYPTPGVYQPILIAEDVSGCRVSYVGQDSIEVFDLSVDFTADITAMCSNGLSPVNFTANLSNPSEIDSVRWYFPGSSLTTATGNSVANVNYTVVGPYDVTMVAYSTVCTDSITKTAYIEVYDPPTFTMPADIAICQGSSTTLGIINGAGLTFAWDTGQGGLSCYDCPNPVATPVATTTYSVVGSNPGGCSGSGSVTVTVDNNTIDLIPDSMKICINEIITLNLPPAATNISWSSSLPISCTTCNNPDITANSNGFVSINYLYQSCVLNETMIVSVWDPASVSAGNDQIICSGDPITLNTSYPGTINWYENDISGAPIVGNQVNPTADSRYYITVENYGCTAIDSFDVTIDLPNVLASPDITICAGDMTSLSVTGDPGTSYQWDVSLPGLSCYSCSTPDASPTETTAFVVTATNINGCTATDTVVVTVNNENTDLLPDSYDVCLNDLITMTLTGVTNVTWTSTLPLSCTTGCLSSDVTATGNGTVDVTYEYNACTITETININVWDPNAVNAGPNLLVCSGQEVVLTTTFPGTINWYEGTPTGTPLASNTVYPTAPNRYYLEVTNNGCSAIDFFDVNIDLPSISTSADEIICIGTLTSLNATGDPGMTFDWAPSTGLSCTNCPNPDAAPNVTTTYTVTGTNTNGCTISEDVVITVSNNTSDILGDNMDVCINDNVQLSVTPPFGTTNLQWGSTLPLSCTNCTNPVVTASSNGTVTISYEYQSCTFTETMAISVWDPASVDAGADELICLGDTVVLSTTYPGTFEWREGSLSSVPIFNTNVEPTVDTWYYVSVTNNGCTGIDSMLIRIDLPSITVDNDQTICVGSTVQLFVRGGNGYTFEWDDNQQGLSCLTCVDPVAQPAFTSTYTVTGTNLNGCAITEDVTIFVDQDSIDLMVDTLYACLNSTISLDISGNPGVDPNSIFWATQLPISCQCETPDLTVDQSGPIVLTYGFNTCSVREEIYIVAWDPNSISAGPDQTICFGDEVQLASSFPGTVEWYRNSMSSPALTGPEIPTQSGTYYLRVTNSGCVGTDTMEVTVLDNANISGGTYEICQGDSIMLSVVGDADSLLWNNANSLDDAGSWNPLASPSITTTYTVIAQNNGCALDTAIVTLTVHTVPTVDLKLPETFIEGDEIRLQAEVTSEGDPDYIWSASGPIDCTTCQLPTLRPKETTFVELEIVDSDSGCAASDTATIVQEFICGPSSIGMPSAFSPNGDGINDHIIPVSLNPMSTYKVFNRWGELVFQSDATGLGWNGKFQGQALKRGIYVYIVEGTCRFDGTPLLISGDFALLR